MEGASATEARSKCSERNSINYHTLLKYSHPLLAGKCTHYTIPIANGSFHRYPACPNEMLAIITHNKPIISPLFYLKVR